MMQHGAIPADAPARAVLHSLAPIGVGTAFCESLESYICRLANSHRVARQGLEALVSNAGGPIYRDVGYQPPRLGGPSAASTEFSRRLAALTMRPEVELLGLGWLAGRASPVGMVRRHRAWCPQCFGKSRAEGTPAHHQMLWSMAAYERCLVHDTVLDTACPHCRRLSSTARGTAQELDHCSWCDSDLSKSPACRAPTFRSLSRQEAKPVDSRASQLLGELVGCAGQLRLSSENPSVRRVVESAVSRGKALHAADLAKRAGLAKSSLHGYMNSIGGKPSLGALLRLALAADVSLAGMFSAERWHEDVFGSGTPQVAQVLGVRRYAKPDWDRIRAQVEAQVRADLPESVRRMARLLDVDQAELRRRIPDLTSQLRLARSEVLARRREKDVRALADRMRQVEAAAGQPVSVRQMAKTLGLRRQWQVFKDARLLAVRDEGT
jgi:hypothetical protein